MEKFDHVRVAESDLAAFVRALMARTGIGADQAEAVARATLDASARGVDTHGVRLVPGYVGSATGGRINGQAKPRFERLAPSAGLVHGDDAFGHLASFLAIDEAAPLARETGVFAIAVKRSSHHGATGCYTRAAAMLGLLALGMTHADALVLPHGGLKPFFGTNPLSFAAPVPGEEPLVIDMATSTVPLNRVFLWAENRMRLRPDVGFDRDGNPARTPEEVRSLAPVGGPDFGYKGMALAMMVDLLCAGLTGTAFGAEMGEHRLIGPSETGPVPVAHFFVLIDPAAFGAGEGFGRTAATMLQQLRAEPGRDGPVLAAGDPERLEASRRREAGIPVDRHTWAKFEQLAPAFDLPLPPHQPGAWQD